MKLKSAIFILCTLISGAVPAQDCPMKIQRLNLNGQNVAYEHFDKNRGEHIAVLNNGDMIIARYNSSCGLGFDAAYFSKDGFSGPEQKKQKAAWLVKQFKNYKAHNKFIMDKLNKVNEFSKRNFKFKIAGKRLDEEHFFSLKNITPSKDFNSELFSSLLTYSWIPPSGE